MDIEKCSCQNIFNRGRIFVIAVFVLLLVGTQSMVIGQNARPGRGDRQKGANRPRQLDRTVAPPAVSIPTPLVPGMRVVKFWDFSDSDPPTQDWKFLVKTAWSRDGRDFAVSKSEPIARLSNSPFQTETVTDVAVELSCFRVSTRGIVNGCEPQSLLFFWARAEDLASSETNWPFETARGTTLTKHSTSESSKVWIGNLASRKHFTGEVLDAFINVNIPKEPPLKSGEHYVITISRIQLLK